MNHRHSAEGRRPLQQALSGLAFAALALGLISLPEVFAQEGMPPATVVTTAVRTGTVTEQITLNGTTRPIRDSLIAAEVDGRVLERRVENGDAVKAGQTLFVLDRVRLERALARAQAELREVEARLRRASRQETRALDLHDKNVLSSNLLDEAVSERSAQQSRKARVEVEIAAIEDDLQRSLIRAPFAGTVVELHTEVGQWLRQGEPIARLAAFEIIEISVDLPERYFAHVRQGAAAPVSLTSLPDLALQGEVFAVVPLAESAARTFPVLVRAANPGGQVGAGMLAQVTLSLGRSEEVLQVPRDALVIGPLGEAVYKVVDGAVERITVRSGRSTDSLVEIRGEGLAEGDRVVVRGNERLMPGQAVQEGEAEQARRQDEGATGSR